MPEPESSRLRVAVHDDPLIGRLDELAAVAESLLAPRRGLVIDAPAGTGKTRLARAALVDAERDGATVLWIQATRSAATIPLGAFAELIAPEIRSDDLFELLARAARAITDQAAGRPLVIGVDDAQLLDPTSAALVAHLAGSAIAALVVTVRSGEPCPDAIVSLWKDGGLARLQLSSLTEAETDALVASIVGGAVQESVRRWVWEVSEGNPMYARELTLGALAGPLRQVGDLWRISTPPPITDSLTALIDARLSQLKAGERATLELLALAEPLELTHLTNLTDLGLLAALEQAALITVEASHSTPVARLGHPLFGEVIRDSLPFLRGRELRLALAAELQKQAAPTGYDALRVARWRLDAGETVPAALLLDAARAATMSGDAELGRRLAQSAVDAGGQLPAKLALARALTVTNRFADAAAVLADAESDVDTPDLAIEYLEQQLAVQYWGLRQSDQLRALLDRAGDWWDDDSWKTRLAPLRLRVGVLESLHQPGDELAETAKRLQHDELDPAARRQLEVVLLAGLFHSGRGREAYELGRRVCPQLPLAGPTDEGILALWVAATVETGEDWPHFEAWAQQALQTAVRLGDHGGAGLAAAALGFLHLHRASFIDARRWLAEAQLHHEQHDPIGLMATTAALQAEVAHALDDRDAADAALRRCHDSLRGPQPPPFQMPAIATAHALAVLTGGDQPHAQRILLDAALELSALPHYAVRLSYEAVRAGAPARQLTDALDTLAERCDSPLVAARAAHVRHRAGNDGTGLLAASAEFERIGARRYASEAAAHAAECFHDQGRQDSARRATRRSRDLFGTGQGGEPPPIKGIDPGVTELTARETQLVKLAQAGLSNAEIAEQLVLSTRTVESHLYRAMQKLGIGDRREL